MGLGQYTPPDELDDDAIEAYRDEDVLEAFHEADDLTPRLLRLKTNAAIQRRQHMLTVLKWVLAHVENDLSIHQAKLEAFERAKDEYDLKKPNTLATEVQQAYKDRKQGEGVQDLFEDGLEQFVNIWERKQEYC